MNIIFVPTFVFEYRNDKYQLSDAWKILERFFGGNGNANKNEINMKNNTYFMHGVIN